MLGWFCLTPVTIIFLCLLVGASWSNEAPSRAGFPLVATEMGLHPAFLGSGHKGWALQLGILPNLEARVWSDRFAISRFSLLTNDRYKMSQVLSDVLANSFPLEGKSPSATSQKISEKLSNGSDLYSGISVPIVSLQRRLTGEKRYYGFALDVRQRVEARGHVPGDCFLALFSDSEGLARDNSLSLNGMAGNFTWTTDFHVQFGAASKEGFFSRFPGLGLPAWGLGLTYRLGHAMLDFESSSGSLSINEDGFLDFSGDGVITGGGFDLGKNTDFDLVLKKPLSGHGHGLSLEYGRLFIKRNVLWGLWLKDLGFMSWNGHVETTRVTIEGEELDFWSISQDDRDIEFKTGKIKQTGSKIFAEPAQFLAQFQYRWEKAGERRWTYPMLSQYLLCGGYYRQYLISVPGHRLTPLLHTGIKNGFFRGYLPLGLALGLGGMEKVYSQLEIEARFGRFFIGCRYRAIGSPLYSPRRGLELGLQSYFLF